MTDILAPDLPDEFKALTPFQARYVLARWAGLSNRRSAEFAGSTSESAAYQRNSGWRLAHHPGCLAALAALHALKPTPPTQKEADHGQAQLD